MEYLIPLGIIIILLGFILIIIGAYYSAKGKTEFALVGLIGPIPFGIASRENLLKISLILMIILLIAFLILNRAV